MKTAQAAQHVGMAEDDLRSVNNIPPRMLLKAGSTLLVPRSAQRQADVPEHLADHATMALAADGPALRRIALRAGKNGETVASIANRYRVSAAQVAQWNKVTATSRFAAGSTVLVYASARGVSTGPVRTASVKVAGRTSAKRGGKSVRTAAATAATQKR